MSETTSETVRRVIRESLQLEADAEIPDDMELAGGEYDLDSLDMLLIVTNLEKAFGIKIANDDLGPETFSSVSTVVAFVEQNR
ncbi:MAG: acyl carrier protein [Phycisphaerales bacterium JB040]